MFTTMRSHVTPMVTVNAAVNGIYVQFVKIGDKELSDSGRCYKTHNSSYKSLLYSFCGFCTTYFVHDLMVINVLR
jgi:hypothetical protein